MLAIDVQGLTKRFGGRTVVDGVDLQVRAGEIHGFLGPNGSGKTTFIRMLCGLLTPDGGRGTCLGHDVLRAQRAIRREVGYMTQRFSFWEDLSLEENLDFVARLYAVPDRGAAVRRSLDELGLTERRHQLAGELSGGWKQRLALAACLIHQPQLLLLDEPTAGVDPKARRDFWDELRRRASEGRTFLVTTHYMDEAERCDRLGFIAYGRLLAAGTVDEVVQSAGLVTWQITGPNLGTVAAALRSRPGVEQVTVLSGALRASGRDAAALAAAVAPWRGEGRRCESAAAGLEEAFVALMAGAPDNFARPPSR